MDCSTTLMSQKPNSTISGKRYLEAAQVFHWATKEHYVLWFTGKQERHKRTEAVLPRLVSRGKLITARYGKRLVYTVPRRKNDKNIEHGLGCTEGLVRIYRSKANGVVIAERFLKGYFMVPEWGIKYGDKLLLYEFCTRDNFLRTTEIKSKLSRYQKNLSYIENKFGGTATVLFVAAVKRDLVTKFVQDNLFEGPFLFTDYQTFLETPMENQLKAPIYMWGEDGKGYPLTGEP